MQTQAGRRAGAETRVLRPTLVNPWAAWPLPAPQAATAPNGVTLNTQSNNGSRVGGGAGTAQNSFSGWCRAAWSKIEESVGLGQEGPRSGQEGQLGMSELEAYPWLPLRRCL